jgi:phosphoketolase
MARIADVDINLRSDGRVMEVLSEHLCQGWLEGYLLTGRHGFFNCYEAFIHTVDSMFCAGLQHLGIQLEDPANQCNAARVSLSSGKCDVRIVEADEDLEIALHSRRSMSAGQD